MAKSKHPTQPRKPVKRKRQSLCWRGDRKKFKCDGDGGDGDDDDDGGGGAGAGAAGAVVVVVMSGQTICFCEPTNPQVKHYRIKIRPPQPLSETNPKHSRFQTVKDEDKRA